MVLKVFLNGSKVIDLQKSKMSQEQKVITHHSRIKASFKNHGLYESWHNNQERTLKYSAQ